jgi:hypothetical protein
MDWLPPWPLIESALRTLMLPASAAAAAVCAVTCAVTKRADLRMAGGVLALIAGLAAGNYFRDLLEWWPGQTPPDEAGPRLPWWALAQGWPSLLPVTAIAAGLGLVAALLPKRVPGIVLRAATAAGVAWWLAEALPPFSKGATFAALFAGMALNHEALLFTAGRTLRRTALLALAIPWAAAASTVLIFAHSARFADLGGLMIACLGGAGLVAALWATQTRALLAAPAAFLPPLMLAGAANTYSEVPAAAFAWVAFAPCALWLLAIPRLRRLPPWAFAAVAILFVLIPCAVAVAMAARVEKLDFGE